MSVIRIQAEPFDAAAETESLTGGRGDIGATVAFTGFCRDEVMRWCEDNGLFFVLGLQKNSRLIAEIEDEMKQARALSEQTGKSARVFKDFRYETTRSWSCERRVIGKAD